MSRTWGERLRVLAVGDGHVYAVLRRPTDGRFVPGAQTAQDGR
jgi:hypothetical protein